MPRSIIILEKLTVAKLSKKCHACHWSPLREAPTTCCNEPNISKFWVLCHAIRNHIVW